jgi:DNA-binding transcriptional MerR regulator
MRYAAHALMIALLAAPAALQAQTPAPRGANPAERLLTARAELSLTLDQVRRLQQISQRTQEQDAELRSQLEALRGKTMGEPLRMRDMDPAQREQLQANRAALQPLMEQLRTLHQQTAADAKAVLTTEQAAQADALLFGGAGRGRGPGAGFGPGGGGGLGPCGGGQGPGAMQRRGPGAGFSAGSPPMGGRWRGGF